MSSSRILSVEEEKELNAWLTTEQIQLSKKTCRELSDVMNMSKLFRKLNKKLVNAHGYPSHSSLAMKINDWENFNLLVLRKLGMALSRSALEDLACGQIGAIKFLLYQLMCEIRHRSRKSSGKGKSSSASDNIPNNEQSDVETDTNDQINMFLGNEAAFEKYRVLQEEGKKKDDYIRLMCFRIKHLEDTKLAKEHQINNLVKRLAEVSVQLITLQISNRYKGRRKGRN